MSIQESIDQLDFSVREIQESAHIQRSHDDDSALRSPNYDAYSFNYEPPGEFAGSNFHRVPTIGEFVSVFWPFEQQYYLGTVHSVDEDVKHDIKYDHDDLQTLDFSSKIRGYDNDNMPSAIFGFLKTLESSKQEVVSHMFEVLGNRSFIRQHTQASYQVSMVKACLHKELKVFANVEVVPFSGITHDANIIGSHTFYKIKQNDDNSFKLQVHIASHRNEDSDLDILLAECFTCPPMVIGIVICIATL